MLSQDIKLGLEHIAEMQKHKSMENYEHHETDDETDNKVNIDRVREIPNLYQCFQGNDYEVKEKKGDEGEAEIKKNDEKGDDDEDEIKEKDEKGITDEDEVKENGEKGDDDEDGIKENDFENDNVEKEGRGGGLKKGEHTPSAGF